MILTRLRVLFIQLLLERQTLAQLVKLTLILLLFVHPRGNIFLNSQSDIQGRANRLPLFSERLLLLRERLSVVCLTLDLPGQGIHLTEN